MVFAVALSVSLAAPAALAQEDEARQHFEEGVRLLEDSRFAAAARELERSLELRDSPSALYNLALAYRGMGRYKKAIELFQRFLKSAGDARFAPMRQKVEAELAELARGLSRVSLVVSGGATRIVVDRTVVGRKDGRYELELDPGPHRIEIGRRGYREVVRQLDLSPGTQSRVALHADADPLPARLVVETNVAGATISLRGRVVARGSFDSRLPPGRHRLRVEAEDHEPFTRELELAAGTTERLNVQLDQKGGGILSSFWFWGGAAVVVAGAATAIFFATRPSDPKPDDGSLDFVVQGLR